MTLPASAPIGIPIDAALDNTAQWTSFQLVAELRKIPVYINTAKFMNTIDAIIFGKCEFRI